MRVLLRLKKKPKPAFNERKPETWSPLIKVLAKWRLIGRTGLTVQALATLLNREPEEVLKEIAREAQYIYGQHCVVVQAIVWSVSLDGSAGKVWLLPCGHRHTSNKTALSSARDELRKWPGAKGISQGGPLPTHGLTEGAKVLQKLAKDGELKTSKKEIGWL